MTKNGIYRIVATVSAQMFVWTAMRGWAVLAALFAAWFVFAALAVLRPEPGSRIESL
jgi:hypothetical protein